MPESGAEPLVCPRCATAHPPDERFCPECGMPLTYAGRSDLDAPVTEAHARARKIKPQYSEGELVRVAGSRNQAEAELIQGLLLEEGVPSMLRRSRGFDVPDMLAAGPRDVMVPQTGADAAREVLLQAELISEEEPRAALAPEAGTMTSRGPAASMSGTSNPRERRSIDGTPSSRSSPWMSSASAWLREPATRTRSPSLYCGLILRARACASDTSPSSRLA